jgi:hypothetical protein
VDTIKEGTSFRDKIEPNKKYYYTFRAIDRHFHFSNPSAIYEVELSSDDMQNAGGFQQLSGLTAVKPRVRIVEFDTTMERSLFKPARKYMRIVPAMEQTLMNEEDMPESAYDEKKIKLGLTPTPLFGATTGRKFKIRLTSKKTGKKIDFNLDFKMEYKKVNKENLNEHIPTLFDVAYSDAEALVASLEGRVVDSVMQKSAKISTGVDWNNDMFNTIVDMWGEGGYSGTGGSSNVTLARPISLLTTFSAMRNMSRSGGGGGSGY